MALTERPEERDEPPTEFVEVEIQPYDSALGAVSWWEDGATLRLDISEQPEPTVVISGNPEGLVSLARHLLTLAQSGVPGSRSMDFDTYCGWLEDGSRGLRIDVEK